MGKLRQALGKLGIGKRKIRQTQPIEPPHPIAAYRTEAEWRIRNVKTGKERCSKHGSWIICWEKTSGRSRPGTCPVSQCQNPVEHGAHVKIVSPKDLYGKVYIFPVCSEHRDSEKDMTVSKGTYYIEAW